ncbi:NAD(P)H-binding protein [Phytoactinopolyspora sp. XMNu-373]|uniref:NAD(P)H-binding protein n=1 Tax=Phytoactinopolyspora mesophila TaxID=2650750 RepID=A0A7K3M1P5_9ACTN|nr:NAD(P)H-binding protein [Phytoactinopolyspora mesophila]
MVLGGTGKVGRRVVAQLEELGHDARAASRRSNTRFDWNEQSTWADALAGAGAVFIMPNDADDGAQLEAFTGLARKMGVRRLVLLSAREYVDMGLTVGITREEIVQRSGIDWTILRPVWFAQNFSEEPFLSAGVDDGEVLISTGAGRHPFIDAEDIAAVAVAALTEEGHAGRTYELTGPRAITVAEAVEAISTTIGRTIRFVPSSPDDYVDYLVSRGLYDKETALLVAGLTEYIRDGHDAHLSDGVQQALGREPRDFTSYVATTAASGRWTA